MSKDSSAKYYQNNKERIQIKSHEKYQSLSVKGKEKKQQYEHEKYKKLSKEKRSSSV